MNNSPTTNTTITALIEQFLIMLFGEQCGWLAIKFGKAPPGCDRIFNRVRWYKYPTELHKVAREAAKLAAHGYDVGFVVSLFSKQKINAQFALPAHFLYSDDLPLKRSPIEPSINIHTSIRKPPQAVILLCEPISPQDREALSRAWTYASDADRSCWDCTQVLRLPGTLNYKHAQPQRVHVTGSGQQQSLVAVRLAVRSGSSMFHKPEQDAVKHGRAATQGWRKINPRRLLGPDGKPKHIPRHAWINRLWNSTPGCARKVGGSGGRSNAFYQLVRGLLLFYSPPEAAALAFYHGAWGHETGKPHGWLETDILRIIGKLLHSEPDRGRTKNRLAEVETQKSRGRGRPAERAVRHGQSLSMGAAELYDWLIEHSDCSASLATNEEISAAIRRTDRTLRRYLDELEAAGLIERHQKACGRVIKLCNRGAESNSVAFLKERACERSHPRESNHLDALRCTAVPVPPSATDGAAVKPADEAALREERGCVPSSSAQLPIPPPLPSLSTALPQIGMLAGAAWGASRFHPRHGRRSTANPVPRTWPDAIIGRHSEAEQDWRHLKQAAQLPAMTRREWHQAAKSAAYYSGISYKREPTSRYVRRAYHSLDLAGMRRNTGQQSSTVGLSAATTCNGCFLRVHPANHGSHSGGSRLKRRRKMVGNDLSSHSRDRARACNSWDDTRSVPMRYRPQTAVSALRCHLLRARVYAVVRWQFWIVHVGCATNTSRAPPISCISWRVPGRRENCSEWDTNDLLQAGCCRHTWSEWLRTSKQ